jgi:hypothetical protein
VGVGYRIDGLDQIGEGVRPSPKLVHQFIDERLQVDLLREQCSCGGGSRLTVGHPGRSLEMGGMAVMMLHLV